MDCESDARLLSQYVSHASEAAFAEIVDRHTDLVFSAALRQVASPDLAKDVTQSVFVDLVRKAPLLVQRLQPEDSLAGWLFRSTRFAALAVLRERQRRENREKEAMNELRLTTQDSELAPDWQRIQPWLDEAMLSLSDTDRDALLLRFFRNRDFKAVGISLGISDDAAQKRVTRALEKLRTLFARRGVSTSVGALSVALSAHCVQSAPAGLAGAISGTILGSAVGLPAVVAATKFLAMTTLQKTLVGAVLAAAIGTGIHEARRASRSDMRIRELEQQQAAMADQLDQAMRDRDRALGQLNSRREEDQRRRAESRSAGVGSRGPGDTTEEAVNSWLKQINLLKQRLQQFPQANIPELRFLKDLDWVEVAANTRLESETDFRKALAELRRRAQGYFVDQAHSALGKYLQANNDHWPEQMAQLESFFDPAVDRSVLERWEIVPATNFPGREFASQQVITERTAVDPEFDSRHTIDGVGSGAVGPFHSYGYQEQPSPDEAERQALKVSLDSVINAYKLANGGKEPRSPSDLQPFVTTPDQQAALQRILTMMTQPQTVKYGPNFRDSTVLPDAGEDGK